MVGWHGSHRIRARALLRNPARRPGQTPRRRSGAWAGCRYPSRGSRPSGSRGLRLQHHRIGRASAGRWACKHFLHFYSMKGKHDFFLQPENRQLARGLRLHVLDDAPAILPILKVGFVVAEANIVDAEVERRVDLQGMDGIGFLHVPQFLVTRGLRPTVKYVALELDFLVAVLAHFCTSAAMSSAALSSAAVRPASWTYRRRPRPPLAGRITSTSGRPRMGNQTSLGLVMFCHRP